MTQGQVKFTQLSNDVGYIFRPDTERTEGDILCRSIAVLYGEDKVEWGERIVEAVNERAQLLSDNAELREAGRAAVACLEAWEVLEQQASEGKVSYAYAMEPGTAMALRSLRALLNRMEAK